MADILIDNEAVPSTPAAGKSLIYCDSTTKKLAQMDDAGHVYGAPLSRNWSTASQGAGFATDTYITNSGLLIPSCGLQVGQMFRWTITLSKTAAGTATPIVQIRLGTNQSTADTSLITLTGQAATAAIAGGIMSVVALIRTVSASGVLVGSFGFASGILGLGGGIDGVSGSVDLTGRAGQYMGVSYNGGASAVITLTGVQAELIG